MPCVEGLKSLKAKGSDYIMKARFKYSDDNGKSDSNLVLVEMTVKEARSLKEELGEEMDFDNADDSDDIEDSVENTFSLYDTLSELLPTELEKWERFKERVHDMLQNWNGGAYDSIAAFLKKLNVEFADYLEDPDECEKKPKASMYAKKKMPPKDGTEEC
jgi:hypothetical protein